ncbi:hypothetical protein GGQ08_001352 [Salinibacter ruber]|nr:hypothetical protein [Salinibacter ruber]MCS3653312.1 hypothetical protein [Salinibacter ruber]
MPGPATGAHVGGGASSGAVPDAVLPTRPRRERSARGGLAYAAWGPVTAPTRSTAAARP